MDDALLYDSTIEGAFWHTWDYLSLCAQNGIVIHSDKFKFCETTVDFAGFTLTPEGITPSTTILSAIKNFPVPTNIHGARSWFGLTQQVAWAYTLSDKMAPFRQLVQKQSKFKWTPTLQNLFDDSKSKIIEAVQSGIRTFDTNRITALQCDWSKTGYGYLLLQKYCSCPVDKAPVCCKTGWKLTFAGSKFTKPAESRYSPTEGEALAVSWALQHSRIFTTACPNLYVITDHKPLLGIFGDRSLGTISNPRIARLKEKFLGFQFQHPLLPRKMAQRCRCSLQIPRPNLPTKLPHPFS